ncbi:hypothetical protein Ancab_021853 [Ancistrocladus abbreviatus]
MKQFFRMLIIPLVFCLTASLNFVPTQQQQRSGTPAPSAVSTTTNINIAAAPGGGGAAIIEKACETAVDKNFCITTLKAKPETKNLDLKGVAFLSLKLAKEQANVSAAYVAAQLKNEENLDPQLDQAYNDCSELYDDVLAQIEDSMQAFLAHNATDVDTFMLAAIADAGTCQQSLDESKVKSPLSARNQMLVKLCNIAFSATHAWLKP